MTGEEAKKEIIDMANALQLIPNTPKGKAVSMALKALEQKPKTGYWIVEVWNNKEHHTCSSCQHVVDYEPCYHYCPYCGARMVEPQESEIDNGNNN